MTYNIQTEEYKTATTCGILVKNIFDKDYGNWRWEDNLQIPWRHNLVSCEIKTRGGVEAVVLPVEEERTRPVDPVGGMKGSKGSKCFDGEFPITPNKGRTNSTVVLYSTVLCSQLCTVWLVVGGNGTKLSRNMIFLVRLWTWFVELQSRLYLLIRLSCY